MDRLPQADEPTLLGGSVPIYLAERARLASAPGHNPLTVSHDRRLVLYWTHHALRVDENPALDMARWWAAQLDLPLLVYQGISEDYAFASDRHHLFMLEAARDLQAAYRELGLRYEFHLQRPGHRTAALLQLAQRSALVVTDDFPLEPTVTWTERLAARCGCPLLLVDTACVYPMRLVERAYERAFAFRQVTERHYRRRLPQLWPQVHWSVHSYQGTPPFEPLDLTAVSLADLVAQCDIDHAVGPVTDTRGGSTAGYARWEAFRKRGLLRYAKLRNDAAIRGVSRMSPYLHYGMVSPLRLAREAHQAGAEKYLDELLIWRELAYNFCFHNDDVESCSALPAWARDGLRERLNDPRPQLLSWETLARGRTGDALWDTAQRSLLRHGELHNNVRMTWGKAILHWTRSPEHALRILIDLNHRYALDGRDPASYGGLLWCLGQFDRPFSPPQPIIGSVRPRPLEQHRQRLNLEQYQAWVDRASVDEPPRVAVVGAGISGLLCARTLHDHGLQVELFEKSRGAGGRMATRRLEDGLQFDHGAQYFTVRDPRLAKYVESWLDQGVVTPWLGRVVTLDAQRWEAEPDPPLRLIAQPGMSRLGQHLANDLTLHRRQTVRHVQKVAQGRYELISENGESRGPFDVVLISCPARQTERLLPRECNWAAQLANVRMLPCWTTLIAWTSPWQVPFDAAFVKTGPIRWLARDSSKPGRPDQLDCWVVQADAEWSERHLEEEPDVIGRQLLAATADLLPSCPPPEQLFVHTHRWRFARPQAGLGADSLWDPDQRLGACGDWCIGGRVEAAALSGMALAGRVLSWLHQSAPPPDPSPPAQLTLFTT
jgi:photolyase PhrII